MRGRNLSLVLSIHSDRRLRAHSWRFNVQYVVRHAFPREFTRFSSNISFNCHGHEKVLCLHRKKVESLMILIIEIHDSMDFQ